MAAFVSLAYVIDYAKNLCLWHGIRAFKADRLKSCSRVLWHRHLAAVFMGPKPVPHLKLGSTLSCRLFDHS